MYLWNKMEHVLSKRVELTIVYNLRETWVRTRRSVRERWEVIRMRMSDGKESRDMLHCQVKSWVCYLTQRAYSVN